MVGGGGGGGSVVKNGWKKVFMVIISLPNLPNGCKFSMLLQYVNFGLILYRNVHHSFNRLNVFDCILNIETCIIQTYNFPRIHVIDMAYMVCIWFG